MAIIDPEKVLEEHEGIIRKEISLALRHESGEEKKEFFNEVILAVSEAQGKEVKSILAWLKSVIRNLAADLIDKKVSERECFEKENVGVQIGGDEEERVSIFETTRAKPYPIPGREDHKKRELDLNFDPAIRTKKSDVYEIVDNLPYGGLTAMQMDGYSRKEITEAFRMSEQQIKKRLEENKKVFKERAVQKGLDRGRKKNKKNKIHRSMST